MYYRFYNEKKKYLFRLDICKNFEINRNIVAADEAFF